jgi:dihydrolipoamide dehydrogenase
MSDNRSVDLLILGAGPGGYVAAIRAAQLGLNVEVVEREKLGGVCLNWGCIPTKALLKSAEVLEHMKHGSEYGISASDLSVDFPAIIERSRKVANRMSAGVKYLFKKNNIHWVEGTATIAAPGHVAIKKDGDIQEIAAKNIIIATGARARAIPGIEFDGERIISARAAMNLGKQPDHLIIIGAGAIGIEFAYFYHTLGTKITVLEMMPQILPIEDREVADMLAKRYRKLGMDILVNAKVSKVDRTDKGVAVTVEVGVESRVIESDMALVAIGVRGNIEDLGLEKVGIKTERGWIEVNKSTYQTSVSGIHAIGDVIGPPWLAHVASAEGIICVERLAGLNPKPIDYDYIPGCTYCQPQVASYGYTAEKAEAAGYEVAVGQYPFIASGKAQALGETEGFVKLVFDAESGKLLGAHILGSDATEMLAEIGLAGTMGATHHDILGTIHAHPTLSESVAEAAADALGEAIHL